MKGASSSLSSFTAILQTKTALEIVFRSFLLFLQYSIHSEKISLRKLNTVAPYCRERFTCNFYMKLLSADSSDPQIRRFIVHFVEIGLFKFTSFKNTFLWRNNTVNWKCRKYSTSLRNEFCFWCAKRSSHARGLTSNWHFSFRLAFSFHSVRLEMERNKRPSLLKLINKNCLKYNILNGVL